MEELIKELLLIMNSMKRQMAQNTVFCGVNHSEHRVLMSIAEYEHGHEPGIKVSDISSTHRISRPAASQILNSLEKKGLVTRAADDKDRRIIWVCLTEEGRGMLAQANQMLLAYVTKIVDGLGEDDTREFIRLSRKLYMVFSKINEERTCE